MAFHFVNADFPDYAGCASRFVIKCVKSDKSCTGFGLTFPNHREENASESVSITKN